MVNEYPFRPLLAKLYWQDVRKRVHEINPVFARLVDEIDPGRDYPIYKACYPYGSLILKDGVCYYPNEDGRLVILSDPSIDPKIKSDLSYANAGFPVGIVITNTIELFVQTAITPFSLHLFSKGHIFGLWKHFEDQKIFHPPNLFNISSGSRTIFLLPHIGYEINHKNLRQAFNIKLNPAKNLLSQWEVFKAILNHPAAKCDWHNELCFFSKNWIKKIKAPDKKWMKLSLFLLQSLWKDSAFRRNKNFFDFAFSQIKDRRNLKPNPYIADTAKHIIEIAAGAFLGFAPAIDNTAAPIDLLQKIFLDVYKLKKYTPTIMQPDYFSLDNPRRPNYYSLSLPITMEFSPKARKFKDVLLDLRELAHILQIATEEIPKEYLKISNTYVAETVKNIKFDYFHDRYDCEKCATHTREMPNLDSSLIQCPDGYDNHEFPTASTFLRGCVRIASNAELKSSNMNE